MALWGGRFESKTDDSVFALSRSVQFDWRLAPYDLVSSIAHVRVLKSGKLIDAKTAVKLDRALKELLKEVKSGVFKPSASDEDVHSALERGLIEKLGELGGSIRAGRSRNDQVATDFRLYLLDHMLEIALQVTKLSKAILAKSSEYVDAVAPGFTHLQHAQPVSFGHELAKHSCALERDLGRIKDWYERSNLSPLGAGALAGSSLPISPERTARDLGFDGVVRNSIDAVSDRDFAVEALFVLALIGVHVSRIGEEWTIWCTSEFGWAKLDDAYATGSSIMPQKKNPDVAELARGKSGPLIGNLTSLLTTMKAMPFAYNRDLQEDKEVVFNSIENLLTLLPALTGMVASTNFDRKRMAKSAPEGFSLATEIADYLVRKGIPFSKAHEAAGKCVRLAEKSGVQLHELSATQLKSAHEQLDEGVRKFLDVKGAIASRDSVNGTAPKSVARQIRALGDSLKRDEKWISNESKRFSGMMSQ
ncbi:MAG: argininosuccinate lyase [Actinobacteria bacterium]|nr:argininosuccinate lyase [Actinomycetota bacterium]